MFPFGTIGGYSSLNAHFYFIVTTSPSIGMRLKLGMTSNVTFFSINIYSIIFSDEGLRSYRFHYCHSRYHCSFIAFRFSRWALACCFIESSRDTFIVDAFWPNQFVASFNSQRR